MNRLLVVIHPVRTILDRYNALSYGIVSKDVCRDIRQQGNERRATSAMRR